MQAQDEIANVPEVKTGLGAKLAVKAVLFPCEFMLKLKEYLQHLKRCIICFFF